MRLRFPRAGARPLSACLRAAAACWLLLATATLAQAAPAAGAAPGAQPDAAAAVVAEPASPAAPPAAVPAAARRPNVVLILADDLGYADVSAYAAGRIPTPNIDRIGAEGARFTAGYVAAPVCGPSRAALLTGRYPQRFGFEFNNGPPRRDVRENLGLPESERTLADLLRGAGYRTALVGKWHLGANAAFYPTGRGFDEFVGFLPGATAYIDPARPGVRSAASPTPGGEPAGEGGAVRTPETAVLRGPGREVVNNEDQYLTDALAGEAEAFIGRQAAAGQGQPFFLYVAFNAPHTPLQVTQRYYDRFPHIADESQRVYAAMVSALDDGVGRVLAALERHGMARDTLVIFASDNGCAAYMPGLCACEPLRGGKLSHFEGGVRVPFMLRWPARVPAGTVHDSPVSTLDVVPTAMAAAATALPADRAFDGMDLLAQLQRGDGGPRALYWWRAPSRSVRVGMWKLWLTGQDEGYLFDLATDPLERNNLFSARPDKVRELRAQLEQWHEGKAPPAWPSREPRTYEACGATITVPI